MGCFSGEVEVHPAQGIGSLKLGMTENEIEAIVGHHSASSGASLYYLDNSLQIDFVKDKAAFIELSETPKASPVYKGMPLLKTKADQVLALFNQEMSYDEDDPELGYSYQYPGLGFWRESDPAVLREELAELGPEDEDEKAFYRDEIERFSFFQTVCVFSEGYYG